MDSLDTLACAVRVALASMANPLAPTDQASGLNPALVAGRSTSVSGGTASTQITRPLPNIRIQPLRPYTS